MRSQERILVVIVLYKRKLADCQTYKTLIAANSNIDVYVHDNSPQGAVIDYSFCDFIYVHDKSNPGLSCAYNRAAEYARKNNFQWLLITDQDTVFAKNAMEQYQCCAESGEAFLYAPYVKCKSGVMSPSRVSNHVTRKYKPIPVGNHDFSYSPINSGMLINVEAFFKVGGYNEKVFLDYSDFEFIERFRRIYDHFFVMNIECFQNFSDEEDPIEKKLNRYSIFCCCLKNCERRNWKDRLGFFYVCFKRCLSLSLQAKSIIPFSTFIKDYML